METLMTTPRHKSILESGTLPKDALTVSAGYVAPSKFQEVGEILERPEVMKLEKEHRLFVHMMMKTDGTLTLTPDQLGAKMGTDGRNIRNWLTKLDKAGLITITTMEHRQIQIKLKEPYYKVAAMKEVTATTAPAPASITDPDLEELMAIYRTAKATGQTLKITTKIVKQYGQPSHN